MAGRKPPNYEPPPLPAWFADQLAEYLDRYLANKARPVWYEVPAAWLRQPHIQTFAISDWERTRHPRLVLDKFIITMEAALARGWTGDREAQRVMVQALKRCLETGAATGHRYTANKPEPFYAHSVLLAMLDYSRLVQDGWPRKPAMTEAITKAEQRGRPVSRYRLAMGLWQCLYAMAR